MNSLWDILSVAIGISFIFMILSILNSWIQDYISTLFNLRARNLADVLQNLLEPQAETLNGLERANTGFDALAPIKVGTWFKELFSKKGWDREALLRLRQNQQDIEQLNFGDEDAISIAKLLNKNPVRTLYMHPIIYSLSKPKQLPDRLPTEDFTVALLDLLDDAGRGKGKGSTSEKITMENIKNGIEKLEKADSYALGYRLRSLLYTAQLDAKGGAEAGMEEFRGAVSNWFDDTVARGSVWYKRRMQRIGIICGFILAIVLNADTVGLTNALWHNAMLREAVTQAAQASANQGQPTGEQAQQQLEQMTNLGLPLGWTFTFVDRDPATPDDPRALPSTSGAWIGKIVGLLLTGFAISQGSQIWFDLMNRLLNLRSAGVPSNAEEPKEKEKSKQG